MSMPTREATAPPNTCTLRWLRFWCIAHTGVGGLAQWSGAEVATVSQWEPSTKRCSACGYVVERMTLAELWLHGSAGPERSV